jgi:hypothetical protein
MNGLSSNYYMQKYIEEDYMASKRWVSKDPPIYVWYNDIWFNERDGREYVACIDRQAWVCGDTIIPFTKKARFMDK